jgi:hypothetical protein
MIKHPRCRLVLAIIFVAPVNFRLPTSGISGFFRRVRKENAMLNFTGIHLNCVAEVDGGIFSFPVLGPALG